MRRGLVVLTLTYDRLPGSRVMPVWVESIPTGDVFHKGLPFEVVRDVIVARLRDSRWFKRQPELRDLVENLEDQDDVEGFDYEWDAIYDLADEDRVWLDSFAHRYGPY